MNIYSFFLVFLIFERAKSKKSDIINAIDSIDSYDARFFKDKSIDNKFDNIMYFDIGKKFVFENYEKSLKMANEKPHENYERDKIQQSLLSVQLENYIMKYIRVFLFHLDLQNEENFLEDDEETKINLEFVINGKDLKFMKELSKNLRGGEALNKLYKLDAIFSSGFKKHFVNEDESYFTKLTLNKYLMSKDFHFAIFCCLIIMLIIFRLYTTFPIFTSLFILLNFLIISEGYIKYLMKLKDAEFEDYYDIGDDCDPEQQSFLSRLWNKYNPFSSDKCLDRLRKAYIKSSDTVFPLPVILDVYKFYFLEMPTTSLGNCMRIFSENLNAHLMFGLKEIGMIFTYSATGIFILCLFVLFMKPRLQFSFFGLNLGIDLARGANEIADNHRRRRLEGGESVAVNRIQDLSPSQLQEKKEEKIALADSDNVSNAGEVSESKKKAITESKERE